MNRFATALCTVILAFAPVGSGVCATVGASLNVGDYLKLADANSLYPSARQLELLTSALPGNMFQPAPPIGDRIYWEKMASTETGQEWLRAARAHREAAPEVPITDEIYRRANGQGNRGIYKPRYYRTMTRLEEYIFAECMENKGEYLSSIEIYLRAIMSMKSWLHPNHDMGNAVLEGRKTWIDLGARKFGSDLAWAEVLLRDKLPGELRREMSAQLRRRQEPTGSGRNLQRVLIRVWQRSLLHVSS